MMSDIKGGDVNKLLKSSPRISKISHPVTRIGSNRTAHLSLNATAPALKAKTMCRKERAGWEHETLPKSPASPDFC